MGHTFNLGFNIRSFFISISICLRCSSERTHNQSVCSGTGFPTRTLAFWYRFWKLRFKCISNSLEDSKNYLVGFLCQHSLKYWWHVYRSSYLVLIHQIECFLPVVDGFGKMLLDDGAYWRNLFTWSEGLASVQVCYSEISAEDFLYGWDKQCLPPWKIVWSYSKKFLELSVSWQAFYCYFSGFLFKLLTKFL